MATFRMICSSSQSQFSVIMLAMVMAGLSLFPVATMAQQNYTNYTSVANGFSAASGTVYVRYSFVYDSHRVIEPIGTVLAPGQTRAVIVDNYPGVQQIEIDCTWFSSSYLFRVRTVAWFFAGPNQTAWTFDGIGLWWGPPDKKVGTYLTWDKNVEILYTPSFLKSSSSSVNSLEESDLMM